MAVKKKTDVRQTTRNVRTATSNALRTPLVVADELSGGKSTELIKKARKGIKTGVQRTGRGLRTALETAKNAGSNTSAAGPKVPVQNQVLNKGKELLDNTGKKIKRLKGESKSAFKQRVGGQTAANEKIRLKQQSGERPRVGPRQNPSNRIPNNLSTSAKDAPRINTQGSPKGVQAKNPKIPNQPGRVGRLVRNTLRGPKTGPIIAGELAGQAINQGFDAAVAPFTTNLRNQPIDQSDVRPVGSDSPSALVGNAQFLFDKGKQLLPGAEQTDFQDLRSPLARPADEEGGFFTNADGTRRFADTEQAVNQSQTSADFVPSDKRIPENTDPNTDQEVTADAGGAGSTGGPPALPSTGAAGERDDGRRRVSLRDALAGFERSDNPLADAAKLQARLGLASGNNTSLQNTLEFEEEQRQSDFDNAIDLHGAQIDELTARGTISAAEADARKAENVVFQDLLGNVDKDQSLSDSQKAQAKKDITFQQARLNPDPESAAVQTAFSIIFREIAAEEDSGFGKFLNAITPGVSDPFSSIFDAADGKAPLLDAETIGLFSIVDGQLKADKGDGVQSHVLSLSDLPDTSAQFLQEVLGRRTALR